MASVELAHSSYLDFTGYRITNATTVQAAYGLESANIKPATGNGLTVAIVLPRQQDPTALLAEDWGTRQKTLDQMQANGTLGSTYGADPALFNTVVSSLKTTYGLTVIDSSNAATYGNYVSSADSRTIWVSVDGAQFQSLFGTQLLYNDSNDNYFVFWNGNLKLPQEWHVQGLWFDQDNAPGGTNQAPAGTSVTLPAGVQSPGNNSTQSLTRAPQKIAQDFYNFPLDGKSVETGAVGLVEVGVGSALPAHASQSFQQLLTAYLAAVGQSGNGTVAVQGQDGQSYDNGAGERSLDIGIVAAINPNSDITLYVGSGDKGHANSGSFSAFQAAIWDQTNPTSVISSSFGDSQSMSPQSPFFRANWELFVDAALHQKTIFNALGDGGAGNETGNGLTNVYPALASPYGLTVGGTSVSTLAAAQHDTSLAADYATPAMAGNRGLLWQLVSGGLTSAPQDLGAEQTFVETVWNAYYVQGKHITITPNTAHGFIAGYTVNSTGSGGVDVTQPVPDYQQAFGLDPVTSDPTALHGRGAPDIAANAGGNLGYLVPHADMTGTGFGSGTSAATPLWASLGVQLNTIFQDQGLPELGYMNDLLYTAAVVAPGSFNDVTVGNNISSFFYGGPYQTNGYDVTPTGYGYHAAPGYDLVTGLGTPNGTLLARALTAIGHAETSFSSSPDLLDADGAGGWTSGTGQSLLFQTMSASSAQVDATLGATSLDFTGATSGTYAWTSQFAQQVLQSDFDPALIRMFDKDGHAAVTQAFAAAGAGLAVELDGQQAAAIQATLSNPFGFADFVAPDGVVRVARPIAVAETAGGQNDQEAVVRLRQNGQDNVSVSFYRVDDFAGSIDGLQPGQAGYAAAAAARAYQVAASGTSVSGPGYGNYAQTSLQHVDAGDLIAMTLTNNSSGDVFWAFSQANEKVGGQPVGHLWNYGLNTWGWEDLHGGGDHDFNDLVVQLDFTSTAGHGWLV